MKHRQHAICTNAQAQNALLQDKEKEKDKITKMERDEKKEVKRRQQVNLELEKKMIKDK